LIERRARGDKGTVVVERSDRRSKHDEHDNVGLSPSANTRMAKESMSCVDLPSDGLLLQICRIQMALFLCDNKDHHRSDMAITSRTIQPAG
jgi:hypothetical protein